MMKMMKLVDCCDGRGGGGDGAERSGGLKMMLRMRMVAMGLLKTFDALDEG